MRLNSCCWSNEAACHEPERRSANGSWLAMYQVACSVFLSGKWPAMHRSTAVRLVHGWGGWIRTIEWRLQRPLPYHLATPQRPVSILVLE